MNNYILNAPFFDSDHPTKGETSTGFSLRRLLPNRQWVTKSYILSQPTQYEDGAVYLRYSQNGRENYNTIQIPALPRVECVMRATANVTAIERGKTQDVVVTIDTGDSYAIVYHEQDKSAISSRQYWGRAGVIPVGAAGASSPQSTYRITVPNVAPNTVLHVQASVSSERVRQMGQPDTDTKSTTITIGEIAPVNATGGSSLAGSTLDAQATGILAADDRGKERFDVSKGIPVTDTLYASVSGRHYLIRQAFRQVSGTIAYSVAVRHPDPPQATSAPTPVLPDPTASPADPTASPPAPTAPPTPQPTTYSTSTVSVSRSYSFWEISQLEVFALASAEIRSAVLPGGKLLLTPSSAYHAPAVDMVHAVDDLLTHHVQTGDTNRSTSTSSHDSDAIRRAAESAVPVLTVRNDRLRVDGVTILSDAATPSNGETPISMTPGTMPLDALFAQHLKIPSDVMNGTVQSEGTIRYERLASHIVNGGTDTRVEQPIGTINAVRVHTPVALVAGLVSDDVHDQSASVASQTTGNVGASASGSTTAAASGGAQQRTSGAVVLGRPFALRLSNTGTHLPITGFGTRDYASYVGEREIRLSFDAYLGALYTGRFVKAGTWHPLSALGIPVSAESIELRTPSWVQPGEHLIEVRSRAVNDAFDGERSSDETAVMTETRASLDGGKASAPNTQLSYPQQLPALTGRMQTTSSANLAIDDHAATVRIPVQVVGRMYDFRITDIEDPMWETFFRTQKGGTSGTGRVFDVGSRNINGETDPARLFTLPVMPGKNAAAGMADRAVKLGYGVKFEIKTIGDYFKPDDVIRLHPRFQHVDASGVRRDVDLYYSLPGKPLIRIGSADDTLVSKAGIDLGYRSLSAGEFTNTGTALALLSSAADPAVSGNAVFLNNEGTRFLRQAQAGVDMFRPWRILLGSATRTFRGPATGTGFQLPEEVDPTLAFASMQKWYGEWRLPADTLIVPAGTDLSKIPRITAANPVFLKEGYLAVNFRSIELCRNGDYAHPVLLYAGRDASAAEWNDDLRAANLTGMQLDEGNGWLLEGYNPAQGSMPLVEGDAVLYYAGRRATDDLTGLGTH